MHRTLAASALLSLSIAACSPASPSTGPSPADTLRIPGAGAGTGRIERLVYQPVSPALPAIPAVNGPLAIRVIEPTSGSARPRSERTIIYGNVGTGQAALEINGTAVPVAPNGAFIAHLPTPQDGAWRLRAQRGGEEVTQTLEHARPAAPAGTAPAGGAASQNAVFSAPRAGTVTGGSDTLATGSDAIYARPTPTGTYRWFFPRGARLSVLERRGDQYRVQLDPATEAWVDARSLNVAETGAPPAAGAITASVTRAADGVDVRARAAGRPFLVEISETGAAVTVYGATGITLSAQTPDGVSAGAAAAGSSSRITVGTRGMPWGYKAWYEDNGDLVVRIRQAPAIDPASPLRGRRIVIDPGHPPAGATGPTGLYEGDANLAISLPLAEKLRARGAEVILTRTGREGLVSSTNSGEELRARVQLAVDRNAELLISVHNNAFGEGADPFAAQGTSVYYFHPMSAGLAQVLDREIVSVTRIRDIGARQSNLALARPTWMPTALTESLFMPIPEQEAALRDPAFLDRLADAHVAGIEAFFRARAAAGGSR
jgi:N-acetylmuramoyl-L-alanine amidase